MRRPSVSRAIVGVLLCALMPPAPSRAWVDGARIAQSTPARPIITEPAADGQVVHPGDVHMATAPYSDTDGDGHRCTTWAILVASSRRRVWSDPCDSTNKTHVHLGDGSFVGPYAGRHQLKYGTKYILRTRHRAFGGGASQWSPWAERRFRTSARPQRGTATAWAVRQDGFRVDVVARGLQLPVNIAFVPTPPSSPSDPYFYVSELRGAIKVVALDGTVSDYYDNVLNYEPPLNFPGSGEQGLTGLAVEPVTGDVFASMLYLADDGQLYAKVVRFHSSHGGGVADGSSVVIDMNTDPMKASHQISNLTFGPDGMLYVHVGDGQDPVPAQDLYFYRGKILRMTLDGAPVPDNPFYDLADGITARDYTLAYGFRNPFGGAWRAEDQEHYVVDNGPSVDRLVKLVAGRNYLWDGTDASMENYALHTWSPSRAPVNIAFVQPGTYAGSGFPAAKMGHAFVTESGPTYATGPQPLGKRITEFVFDANGDVVGGPTTLVEYTGIGKASVSGLAAGPDGLYFTDLYRDLGASGPTHCCAQVLRVSWTGD